MKKIMILVVVLGFCSCSSNKSNDLSILPEYLYAKIFSASSDKEKLIKSIIKDPNNLKYTIENCVFYDSMFVADDIKDTLLMNEIANLLIPYKHLSTFKLCDYSVASNYEYEDPEYFEHRVAVMLDNKKCLELTFKLIKMKWYFYNIDILSKHEMDWILYEDCFQEK